MRDRVDDLSAGGHRCSGISNETDSHHRPVPLGGATDFIDRVVARKLTECFHQGVIIDNRRAPAAISLRRSRRAQRPTATSEPADEHAHGAPARMGWARLLKRVFDIDLEHCPQCGGEFKIIAAIEEPAVIVKNLTHLGLPARAPPRSPARRLDLFQAA